MAVAPKNLIIPGKNSRGAHLGYKDDMRTIEMWANNLKVGGGGALYASLTGPGETNPTGKLTQAGDLEVAGNLKVDGNVSANTGTQHTFETNTANPAAVLIEDDLVYLSVAAGAFFVNVTLAGDTMTVVTSTTGQINWTVGEFNVTGLTQLLGTALLGVNTSSLLGFYGNTGVTQPVVTGSRGGNVALASLLTALTNLGLITNSTTP